MGEESFTYDGSIVYNLTSSPESIIINILLQDNRNTKTYVSYLLIRNIYTNLFFHLLMISKWIHLSISNILDYYRTDV